MRKISLAVVAVLVLIVIAFNRKQVQLTAQTNFELQPIGTAGFELKTVIHLKNPNLLSSTIKSINENFYFNGNLVGEIENEISQGIPGLKETAFPISIRLGKDGLLQNAERDSMQHQLKLNILTKGKIVFENLTGGGTIEVNQTDTIFIPFSAP
jgi:LEA14-like dessication related protein